MRVSAVIHALMAVVFLVALLRVLGYIGPVIVLLVLAMTSVVVQERGR